MGKDKKDSRKKKKLVKKARVFHHTEQRRLDGAPAQREQAGSITGSKVVIMEPKTLQERPVKVEEPPSAQGKSLGRRSSWVNLLPVLVLCTLAFIIYSNTMTVPFVFDDRTNITDNPPIQLSEITFANIINAAFRSPVPTRPLANVTFALNYYFHQQKLPGYHIVNLVIHAINGILLYFLFVTTLRLPAVKNTLDRPELTAFAAAIIWLAHPIQTQSVTYIVQRMNSMATMFYLLAMLLYVTARLSPAKRMKILMFSGCTLSGLAGFWSKEIVITLPFFLLLYEFYFFQDLDTNWLKSRPFILALLVLFIGTVIVSSQKLGSLVSSYNIRQFTLEQRLLTEPRVILFHMSQLIFPLPSRFNLFHDFPISLSIIKPLTTLFSVTAIAGLLGLAAFVARRRRLLSFCLLWFFGNLALESSIFPLEIIFEHRNYLPSTFFCLIFTVLVIRGLRLIPYKNLAPAVLLLVALNLSFLTYNRNGIWRDEETLLLDCLQKAPNVARTQASLGYVLMWQWRLDEATRRFQIALRLNPTTDIRLRIQVNMDFINKMRQSPRHHKS